MTKYNIASHPTFYNGVNFRSRLEARWAAFFDLNGLKWEYEPIDLVGWVPDFRLFIPCNHSECDGEHVLLVEVKPYSKIEEFEGHPCLDYPYGQYGENQVIPASASAAFGINPNITYWEMAHGSGGGEDNLINWIDNYDMESKWKKAGNMVRWEKKQ